MQTVPDSHFWTSIEMLIGWAKYHSNYNSRERSVEYLVKGLENTLKNGYDISKLPSPSESNSNEAKDKRIKELEDGLRAIIDESGKNSFAGARATQLLTSKK